jgi:hypothetical protein
MYDPYQPKPADAFQQQGMQTMGQPMGMGGFQQKQLPQFNGGFGRMLNPMFQQQGMGQPMGPNPGPQVMQPEVSPMPPGMGYQPPGLLNASGPHAQGGPFQGFGGGRMGGFAPQGAQMAGQFGGGLFGGAFRNGGIPNQGIQSFTGRGV